MSFTPHQFVSFSASRLTTSAFALQGSNPWKSRSSAPDAGAWGEPVIGLQQGGSAVELQSTLPFLFAFLPFLDVGEGGRPIALYMIRYNDILCNLSILLPYTKPGDTLLSPRRSILTRSYPSISADSFRAIKGRSRFFPQRARSTFFVQHCYQPRRSWTVWKRWAGDGVRQ